MKISFIRPLFVDIVPDQLEDGILYICEQYKIVIHKCCCGCGEEVVTPLSPADWSLRKEGGSVSLEPSIGNWSYNCKSHYWITKNRVIWGSRFSQRQIDLVKARDKADKRAYIEKLNHEKGKRQGLLSLLAEYGNCIVGWFKSIFK